MASISIIPLPPPPLLPLRFLLFLLIVLCHIALSPCSATEAEETNDVQLRIIKAPGVILHKTFGPLAEGPVEESFPGTFPARFIRQAWGIDAPNSIGGKKVVANQTQTIACTEGEVEVEDDDNDNSDALADEQFGAAILSRAKEMFAERQNEDELGAFLQSGVSNPDAGPRRMHWVGIQILPNQSLALHSHPNIEFAYIVEGIMHEHRIVDATIRRKKKYIPERIEGADGETHFKYHGPDHLVDIDANKEGVFQHNFYTAGEMFINAIGDVHQSFTMEEGVKLFVMWGDGNADISDDKYPRGSGFLNVQSAKAWE